MSFVKNVSGKSDVFLSVKPAKKVVQNELAKSSHRSAELSPVTVEPGRVR